MFGHQNHPNRRTTLLGDFLRFGGCASRSKTSSNVQRKTAKQTTIAAQRTKHGAENDSTEPWRFAEPQLKASLGKRLACVDRPHSEAIDYRPDCFRSGLAAA
jgi:hypothetical protein